MDESPYRGPALRASGRTDLLLASGGLDSYIMWVLLDQPDALYIRCGSEWGNKEEWSFIDLFPGGLHRTVSDLSVHARPDGHIPFRNLYFCAFAATEFPAYRRIYLGALRGETSRDKSGKFFRDLSRLLTYLEGPTTVEAPFRSLTKTQLVRQFIRHRPDLIPDLRRTLSCYHPFQPPQRTSISPVPDMIPCGACMACFRRWVAMTNNGIRETYVANPAEWYLVAMSSRNAGLWLRSLLKTPLREWYGVFRNNMDAAIALRRAHHAQNRPH
jgi:7-cyano-7-deazaguanine synthase